MRIIAVENFEEYKDKNLELESEKLYSHLRRAFFDICDMLSINYRNKIIDVLEMYSVDEISEALPDYYSEIRPYIERVAENIAKLRTSKRFAQANQQNSDFIDVLDEYPEIIKTLKEYYLRVSDAIPSLNDIQNKNKRKKKQNVVTQWLIHWCYSCYNWLVCLVLPPEC